ncbi:hypothetical protein GCM10023165_40280 [Variovorax defluvii]|uniref:Uncharacterized protein n=1 Tax=Variovorax defluvii TaxID=913761 RepID=A0ABP8I5C1_9BURK
MSVSAISSFIHQFTSTRGLDPASEDEQGVWTLQVDEDVLLSMRAGPDEEQITVFSSPGYVVGRPCGAEDFLPLLGPTQDAPQERSISLVVPADCK